MADECLTKPCAVCGKRITGANWHCRDCEVWLCFVCGVNMDEHICPRCGRKLE